MQEQQWLKLDLKSRKCILLGYEKGIKGYKLYNPVVHRKVISKDVVSNEESMLKVNRDEEN